MRGSRADIYQPLHDMDVETAFRNWMDEWSKWVGLEFIRVRLEHPDLKYDAARPYHCFCNWHGEPPDPKYYRPPWTEAEATWFQMYATVSEGTPVSPPFATKEELVEYLVANGDYWDQKRGHGG
jgi:hypothetical protein